ncbi:hypothetical protein HYH02_008109 [Chlamydomonas schloesseri]|uniref:Uncharacterized protein n=1 Tax=Chlamydomonas schloesseri TaxID=2026947 RepID=A0A835WH85_9CHLO|nr:hypothetical protein HYH02_008109 [Chlamydomonas schloesseri]|eukprot:KAG2446955.1 hypothetical protein HYH02_008109 [Chlamydomonas schloesseri]
MGKMDPTQMDRWWKSRIQKEELQYGVNNGNDGTKKASPRNEKAVLNTMGTAQVVSAAEHHLAGAGAVVRQPGSPRAEAEAPKKPASVAGSAARAGKAGSVARSGANTETGTTLMRRLEGLEEALAEERMRRMAAEEEMRQLVAMATTRKVS